MKVLFKTAALFVLFVVCLVGQHVNAQEIHTRADSLVDVFLNHPEEIMVAAQGSTPALPGKLYCSIKGSY